MNFVRRALLAVEKRIRPGLSRPEVWQQVAVAAVNIVLVIALAHSLATLTLAVLSGRSPPAAALPVSGEATGKIARTEVAEDAAIAGWHLFGRVDTGRTAEALPATLPATPLNLRLAGVFFVERGSDRALALIADGGGPERGYRIGDSLPGSARLERIQRDHVVVSRDGRQEMLSLPKLDQVNRPAAPTFVPSALPAAPESESSSAALRTPQIIDASVIAGRLREEVSSRPQALEDIAFASPYLQNGQFAGYRLRPGRDRQIFQQLGLNGGDVLTEINGVRLSNPAQGLMLLQELLSASRIDARVLRNGAEIPLTFSLDGPAPNERN